LVHATYWENVNGILREGIVPAKNPTSSFRQPFKKMLQGAENHVYAVNRRSLSWSCPEQRTRKSNLDERQEEVDLDVKYCLEKEVVGLETDPDAFFIINLEKAMNLDIVVSGEWEENIFIQGPVPPEVLSEARSNDPVNLPDSLKAKIVDPKSFEQIPIIDLSGDENTIVEEFRFACEVVGFMQIVGHGISPDLMERHIDLQKRLFALPEEVKRRLAVNGACPVRGYFGKGEENLDQVIPDKVHVAEGGKLAARTDNKEGMDLNGVPWSKPKGGYVANVFGMPSQLPTEEELPNFRETMEVYCCEMFELSKRILSFMARVLNKPSDFFESHLAQPVATHRLLHYWPLKDFFREIGVGEHTDYGLLTVLKQDNVGGLQVLNAKDLHWVHATPIQDAFVVNIGDMLARWTGHRFKSTIHRVVNVSKKDRYSVPYFLEPNMETLIIPGDLCNNPSQSEAAHIETESVETAEEILSRFYSSAGLLNIPENERTRKPF